MTNKEQTERVELGSRSYDIIIGNQILDSLIYKIKNINSYSKFFIITDENVAHFHLDKLIFEIKKSDVKFHVITVKAGEKTKDFSNLHNLCEEILALGVDRKSLIIAFGGGVIGDLSGFVASMLLRGIDFVQVPTTLLSAVDSSVGGKNAINSVHGKNLIGSFYQPKLVFCDLQFLETLPKREFLSGYGEVVKYGIIRDLRFFGYLENNWQKIVSKDIEILKTIIAKSCKIKAEIVSLDEKENNLRAILNFGHTFGHVFEAETNYSDEIMHGEAVAIGMVLAAKMSVELNLLEANKLARIKSHLENVGLMISHKDIRQNWNIINLVRHLHKDKKVENGNLTFILLDEIGSPLIKKDVNESLFIKVIS